MAKILGYIAASLDGFIATEGDSLDWLFAYGDLDLGEHDYRQFIKRITTVVMGRGTYDFLARIPRGVSRREATSTHSSESCATSATETCGSLAAGNCRCLSSNDAHWTKLKST